MQSQVGRRFVSLSISRRTFVHGAIGVGAAAALLSALSSARVTHTYVFNQGRPNLESDVRLRGLNHVGNFNEVRDDTIWAALWRAWDWKNLIKPQLDDIAKVGNVVRFFGNTLVIANGSITLAQYLSQWKQLLDYVSSLDLYIYPTGGDLGHWGNYRWDQSTQTYTELASLLTSYPNVIGMDVVNEAFDTLNTPRNRFTYNQPEPVGDLLAELASRVRSAGIPVTFSRGVSDRSGWQLDFFTDHLGDFLDFHIYYTPGPKDSLTAYQQSWGEGKQMIVGEFGANTTVPSATRSKYYNAVRVMCGNDPHCLGALAWSAWDLAPTEQYGLYDPQRRLRTDISKPFAAFPIRQGQQQP